MVKPVSPPICPYCGGETKLVTGDVIREAPDRKFWYCAGDFAFIGAQARTGRPLGTIADPDLRAARASAHSGFGWLARRAAARDNIDFFRAQGHAYKWLREQMQLPASERCDIEFFNLDQCRRVVEICQPLVDRIRK